MRLSPKEDIWWVSKDKQGPEQATKSILSPCSFSSWTWHFLDCIFILTFKTTTVAIRTTQGKGRILCLCEPTKEASGCGWPLNLSAVSQNNQESISSLFHVSWFNLKQPHVTHGCSISHSSSFQAWRRLDSYSMVPLVSECYFQLPPSLHLFEFLNLSLNVNLVFFLFF